MFNYIDIYIFIPVSALLCSGTYGAVKTALIIGRCNKYIFKGLLSVICSMVFVLVPYLQLGEVLEENL